MNPRLPMSDVHASPYGKHSDKHMNPHILTGMSVCVNPFPAYKQSTADDFEHIKEK